MLNVMRRVGAIGLAVVLMAWLLPTPPAAASIGACGASVSPSSLTPGSDATLDVRVSNITGPSMVWIQVARPSADYAITGAIASNPSWQPNVSSNSVVFTGGLLNGDGSVTLHLDVHAVAWESNPANWTVRASDSPYGAAATDCGGAKSTTIQVYEAPENTGLDIANVTADPTATEATIRWTSDLPTGSGVVYGVTSDYGASTAYNPALTTDHEVKLSGLTPQTVYHFQVAGLDDGNAPYYSDDNTFLTSVLPIDNGGGGGGGGLGGAPSSHATPVAPTAGPTPSVGAPSETVPPAITLATKPTGAYKQPPTFSGTASDNVAVARVDYSVDGGKTWLSAGALVPVTTTSTTGSGRQRKTTTTTSYANVSFAFTPVLIDDGNYSVLARATDTSGNQAQTAAVTLVIDRLPPRLGAGVVTTGAQVVVPDAAGRWPAVVDVDQTVTLSAVGGPITMAVQAVRGGGSSVGQTFQLTQNQQSGLWVGALSFHRPGSYQLTVNAVDGAGNHTQSSLPEAVVSPAAQLVGAGGQAGVSSARVMLYYRQPDTGAWVPWDGQFYGQANPQTTRADGSFRFLAPAGTYYLQATAPGYQPLITRQFTLSRATPLVPKLQLTPDPVLRLARWSLRLPLPWPTLGTVTPATAITASAPATGLIGQAWPSFDLPATTAAGATIDTTRLSLLGQPTLVTALALWAPSANEQLPALAALQTQHQFNVVPLVLGERASQAQAFLARANSAATITVDPGADLSQTLGVPSVPVHYLLDRNGIVRRVLWGVVSEADLASALSQL
ncbi:MAG TPA: Ig-like domain-containing protein [Candidatus Saccharimonadia bacterium]|nr:Ig-like domain-containing protein [Candidatus Saccharimonadia bacterium]